MVERDNNARDLFRKTGRRFGLAVEYFLEFFKN